MLGKLDDRGALARVVPSLPPRQAVDAYAGLAALRLPLSAAAGGRLRERVCEAAPELDGPAAVQCLRATATLQRALRRRHAAWRQYRKQRRGLGAGSELWYDPHFRHCVAQIEAAVVRGAEQLRPPDAAAALAAFAALQLEPTAATAAVLIRQLTRGGDGAAAHEVSSSTGKHLLSHRQIASVFHSFASLQLELPPNLAERLEAESLGNIAGFCEASVEDAGQAAARADGGGRPVRGSWLDRLATVLWSCAALDARAWARSELVQRLLGAAAAAAADGSAEWGGAATTQLLLAVHRFEQAAPRSLAAKIDPAAWRERRAAELRRRRAEVRHISSAQAAASRTYRLQTEVFEALQPFLPDAELEVLPDSYRFAMYSVDIWSPARQLAIEVNGLGHYIHPPLDPSPDALAAEQAMLWVSTALESKRGSPAGPGLSITAVLDRLAVQQQEATPPRHRLGPAPGRPDAELVAQLLETSPMVGSAGLAGWKLRDGAPRAPQARRGPWFHFARHVCGPEPRENGATALKRALLEEAGATVLSVPWWEFSWAAEHGQTSAYLKAALASEQPPQSPQPPQ